MAVKIGSFVIPGTSNFSVSGVGFKPLWSIFLFTNKGVEDTWLPDACGGIAFTALRNNTVDDSGIGASLKTCQVSERWYDAGGIVAGSFLGNVTMWVRQTNGSNGWAVFTSSTHDDGWNFTFSDGFSSGAGGQIVYYLAGDEAWEEVGSTEPIVPGSSAYDLGWEPQAVFSIGGGGGAGAPGSTNSFSWFDRSHPTVSAGDWGEYSGELGPDQNAQWRGILDPNVNVQHYYGHTIGFNPVPITEGQESGGAQFTSNYSLGRTLTSYNGSVTDTGGFSDGAARMMPLILGTVDSRLGSFTPLNAIGVPTQVDLGFTPEAVVFFSPGEHNAGVGDPATQGATGWGFCDENDEAFIIYGGHWNPPVAFQSAVMMSRNRSWCGNYLTAGVSGTVGTMVNAGTAHVIPNGFEYTTLEDVGGPVHPVSYWAIAPAGDITGFFMIVD